MFSRRLLWNQSTNALSERIASRSKPYLDLTISNPTTAGFVWRDDLLSELSSARALSYSPDARGMASARDAVGEYLGMDADKIVLTASTSEAYSFLFQLVADAGDEVLAPQPSYPLFEFLAGLSNVRMTSYPLFYDHGWSIDIGGLEAAITPRTRAIVLVNPNNPTGGYLKRAELSELERICLKHDLALISDEVFADFRLQRDDGSAVECVAKETAVTAFSLGGLSKACGLPQLKLGWIASNSADAVARLELIADTFLSVGTPVQVALPGLLNARQEIQIQIRGRLARNLALLPKALIVEGGWYAIVKVPQVKTEEQWALDLLDEYDVLVQPGYYYDFATGAQIVLSLLTREAEFAEGVRRIQKALTI